MFHRRRKFLRRKENNVYELEKPNTRARKILLFFEIVLVLAVLAGIGFGVNQVLNFSPRDFISENLVKLVPIMPQTETVEKIEGEAERIIKSLPEEIFALQEEKSRTVDELSILSKQGTLAIFSLKKDVQFQLDTLQNLLTKAKINKKTIKKIDLRFDKVVVVYEE